MYFLSGGADSAKRILTIISGAMIGVAGTVFSITLVALTLASSQLGPRLLQNFMHDRLNQIVLGNYIATFIFCLIVLRTIIGGPEEFVPNISVIFAILVSIANIILLVFFIHHISVSIQANHVIARINASLQSNIKKIFPENKGDKRTTPENPQTEKEIKEILKHRNPVISTKNGYIQAISYDTLLQLASELDLYIDLKYMPGDFMIREEEIAIVYSGSDLEKKSLQKIVNAFLTGNKRTPGQDAEFSIHQMVEIAVKALSPGINDPYTAISCIDNLTASICYLTGAVFPSTYQFDKEEKLRLKSKVITFNGIMNAAFNQIRQYGSKSPSVLIRLTEAFEIIHRRAKDPEHKKTVRKHADMVFREAEKSIHEKNDLEDLKKRYSSID